MTFFQILSIKYFHLFSPIGTLAMRYPAMESAMSVQGIPSSRHSQVVSRAPFTQYTSLHSTYSVHCINSVERCKRPILCLASSKILKILTTRPPHHPASLWCGERTHSLVGKGVGGQYFGRRQTLLCTLHT
jgi:hypothetical protein